MAIILMQNKKVSSDFLQWAVVMLNIVVGVNARSNLSHLSMHCNNTILLYATVVQTRN